MKRFASLLILSLACALGAPVATATPMTFVALLSGANENPANASSGIGSVAVVIDPATHFLRVIITFSDLLGTTTAAHIHCCAPPGSNAMVATAVPTFPGFPLGVTSGTYDMAFDTSLDSTWNPAFITAHGGTAAGAEADFFAGLLAGQAYQNVHSSFRPGGEIRGNLAIPEPATLALVGLGLAGLGFARRGKRVLRA